MIKNFDLYSSFYDLLYQDKLYEVEANYVVDIIKKYNSSFNSILNLGSGTGRHDEEFQRLGFSVKGLEQSGKMVDVAISKGLDSIIGDITQFELSEKFDSIVSLFHVISYLTANDQILDMFTCVGKHLNDDGVFLFDVWFTPAVYSQKPEIRSKVCDNKFLSINRLATPKIDYTRNIVDVKYDCLVLDKKTSEEFSFTEYHMMRHFSVSEMEYFAKHSGFVLLQFEEFLTGNPLTDKTWGACFVFKKKS
jgi:SAM-dependent methyltransferase